MGLKSTIDVFSRTNYMSMAYKTTSLLSYIGRASRSRTQRLDRFRGRDSSVLFSWPCHTSSLLKTVLMHFLFELYARLKLASLEEFHLPSFRDFWTYCWRLLSNCSVLAVWSNLNQQPIHSHLPRQRGSCKQISPTFVTYPASFLNAVFPLFYWILNYATWWKIQDP